MSGKPVRVWAIKGPRGGVQAHIGLHALRAVAISYAELWAGNAWKYLRRMGYRAVRVRIIEEESGE